MYLKEFLEELVNIEKEFGNLEIVIHHPYNFNPNIKIQMIDVEHKLVVLE